MLYCKHRRRLDAMHWILKHKGKGECIENNGGKTLSYDANQGIRILEIDGYAFKDINGNGEFCLLYTSYPQNRVTDHRIGYNVNQLDRIMEGRMQDLLDALCSADQQAKLAGQQ